MAGTRDMGNLHDGRRRAFLSSLFRERGSELGKVERVLGSAEPRQDQVPRSRLS